MSGNYYEGLSKKTLEKLQQMLLDDGNSNMLFEGLKSNLALKLQTLSILSNQIEVLVGKSSSEHLTHTIGVSLMDFMKIYVKETIVLFDLIATINKNVIENRKGLLFLAKELVDQKVLSEDTSKLIIEMYNKLKEKQQYSDNEVKELSKQVQDYLPTLKLTKRNYEDEARDTTTE